MISAQDWEVAINRLYYAAFHAVSALLFKNDIKVKAYSGAKAMLELHFVKTSLLSVEWGGFMPSCLMNAMIVIMKTLPFSRQKTFSPYYRKLKNSLALLNA
ncbi:HEPN domain-containing protein [Spirosoma lituiforme]